MPTKKLKTKFKSKLEQQFFDRFGLAYETTKFPYTITYNYTPDWEMDKKLFLETKGYFDSDDRRKALAMKEQHPDVEVVFVFENASKKIHAKSATTYGEWCKSHGFKFLDWKEIKTNNKTIKELRRVS